MLTVSKIINIKRDRNENNVTTKGKVKKNKKKKLGHKDFFQVHVLKKDKAKAHMLCITFQDAGYFILKVEHRVLIMENFIFLYVFLYVSSILKI